MALRRERLRVPVSQSAEMQIWDTLRRDYAGLIHEIKAGYWSALSRPFEGSGERVTGDVFFPREGTLLYYRIDPRRQYIDAGCLSPDGEGAQILQGFCERIRDAVSNASGDGRDSAWTSLDKSTTKFDRVREEGRAFTPTPTQLEAARALADPAIRHLLATIHEKRNVLLENLAVNGASALEVNRDIAQLEDLGLVQKDFVVFCRDQGNQISRVSKFAEIEEATRRGFKCFACGRLMAEERIDQLISCTPEGTSLARPNRWLALLLSRTLGEIGIPLDSQVTAGAPDASRVLDLFASTEGVVLMFETRDGDVGLDDAWRFLSRVRYYRPDAAFYLTTRPLPPDVRRFLEQSDAGAPIALLDEEGAIKPNVERVLALQRHARLRDVVRDLEQETQVDVGALLYDYFFADEARIDADRRATGTPAEGDVIARGATEPPAPPIGEAATLSPTPADDLGAAEDLAVAMMQQEMFTDSTIIELPDLADLGDVSAAPERAVGVEERELIFRRVQDDLAQRGVAGRLDEVRAGLARIDALPASAAAVVSDDELIDVDRVSGGVQADQAAAMANEIVEQAQRSINEFDGGRVQRVTVEAASERLHLGVARDRTLLLVREQRPYVTTEGRPPESIASDAAPLAVLEGLSSISGVRGAILASRDGLVIEQALQAEAAPAEVLATVLSLILVDNERLCHALQLQPIRQISVRTEACLYAILPLENEDGVLVVMLDPVVPPSAWRAPLRAAAATLATVFQ